MIDFTNSPIKGMTPFFINFMKELSVFVDEAGVFGPYDYREPYYILSFMFHDQEDTRTIEDIVSALPEEVFY